MGEEVIHLGWYGMDILKAREETQFRGSVSGVE